ncbi:MAG: glycosyltransferase family 2 protein [Treponema sp.]|jgi:glycosyltransferase involved in cell wall biosynthesis|nr:glycosyltransferase family 2 protein [Treponema sp.]
MKNPDLADLSSTKIFLALIVPCYNEAEVLHETAKRLGEKIKQLVSGGIISDKSQIVFIDDGSTDRTWTMISAFHEDNPVLFSGIKLSRNSGHQNALLCGLLAMKEQADAVISMDADLQDDIAIIDDMLEKHLNGAEIVYGVRSDRKTDHFFKRITAQAFYRLMRFLGTDIIYNHADFRLMGKRALDALAEYKEVNLFLRGLIPMIGYTSAFSFYTRVERFAGESKYPLRKMLKFALEGITSLSIKPIRFITMLGVLISVASVGMIVYFLFRHFSGHTIIGWSSLIVSLWAIGGLILFSIGIVGEYIGKIYLETKQRPRYRVETILTGEQQT